MADTFSFEEAGLPVEDAPDTFSFDEAVGKRGLINQVIDVTGNIPGFLGDMASGAVERLRRQDKPTVNPVSNAMNRAQVEAQARGWTSQEIDEAAKQRIADEQKPGAMSEYVNALAAGTFGGNPKMYGKSLEVAGILSDSSMLESAGKRISSYGESVLSAAQPQVGSIEDVMAGKSASKYIAASAGQAHASMLPGAVIGALTTGITKSPAIGLLASFGTMGPLNLGDVYSNLEGDKAIQEKVASGELSRKQVAAMASMAAVPISALDAWSVGQVFAPAWKEAKGELVRRIVKGVASGAITEGSTEGLQEVISIVAGKFLGSESTAYQNLIRVADNAIGGAFGGGIASGVSTAVQRAPAPTPPRPDPVALILAVPSTGNLTADADKVIAKAIEATEATSAPVFESDITGTVAGELLPRGLINDAIAPIDRATIAPEAPVIALPGATAAEVMPVPPVAAASQEAPATGAGEQPQTAIARAMQRARDEAAAREQVNGELGSQLPKAEIGQIPAQTAAQTAQIAPESLQQEAQGSDQLAVSLAPKTVAGVPERDITTETLQAYVADPNVSANTSQAAAAALLARQRQPTPAPAVASAAQIASQAAQPAAPAAGTTAAPVAQQAPATPAPVTFNGKLIADLAPGPLKLAASPKNKNVAVRTAAQARIDAEKALKPAAAPATTEAPAAPQGGTNPVETFAGQDGKGLAHKSNADQQIPRFAKQRPDLDWRAEPSTGLERPWQISGYARTAQEAPGATPAAPAAEVAPKSEIAKPAAPTIRINGQLLPDMNVQQLQHAVKNDPYPDRRVAAEAELKVRDKRGETAFGKTMDQLTDAELKLTAAASRVKGVKAAARLEQTKRATDVADLAVRLKAPGTPETLRALARSAGWEERGGFMIRSGEGAGADEIATGRAHETGAVVGKTKWVPKAEWWEGRPVVENEVWYRNTVAKAIAGEKLTAKQTEAVKFLLDLAENEGESVPADTTPVVATAAQELANAAPEPDNWSTLTESEKDDELDAIFGTDTRPAAEGAQARQAVGASEVGQAGAAEAKPAEVARPALDLKAASPEELQAEADRIKAAQEEANRKAGAVEGAKKRAANKAELDRRAEEIRKERANAAVAGFALGQEAPLKAVSTDQAAGQGDVFAAKPMTPADHLEAAAKLMREAAAPKEAAKPVGANIPVMAQDKSAAANQPTPAAAGESKETVTVDGVPHAVEVYRDDEDWSYRIDGKASDYSYDTAQEAKADAHRELSPPIQDGTNRTTNSVIYRAHRTTEQSGIRAFTSWSEKRETSESYTSNPGFGGSFIRSASVDLSNVLDVDPHSKKGLEKLAKELGYENPMDIADKWWDQNARYPWENSGELKGRLGESGYAWMRYEDDFPEGAITLVALHDISLNESPAPQSVGAQPAPEQAKAGEITDFGEKIAGARKDYATKLAEAKDADIAAVPLSQSWPEPDYAKLLEGGADPWAVAFMHAARDEVPTKPNQRFKLERWVAMVEKLRDVSLGLAEGAHSVDRAKELLAASKTLAPVAARLELYQEVGHAKSLKGIVITAGTYSLYNKVEYNPPKTIWSVESKAVKTAMSHWPKMLATGDTREQAIANFKKAWLETTPEQDTAKSIDFQIYSGRDGDKRIIYVGKKIGSNVVKLKEFENVKDARAWKEANQAELIKMLERYKDVPYERKETNSPRVGVDHRNGADVTPERFTEAFGFRGVQFGNYVEGSRRQADLNEAYDALMDLAGVLDIPPKALSLNGELGLAFGARGTGGKQAPSAHYEPGQVVINLTKAKGAGSLAHEWFHGVDNYFSRMAGAKAQYLTETQAAKEGVRPEMVDAFKRVMAAIQFTDLRKRSIRLDRTRSKPYWQTRLEMAARSFESYIVAKLQDQNASNDYLANIVSEDYWKAATALGMEKDNTFPYPTTAEMTPIRAAFDNFFQTVETRETDKGVAMFRRDTEGESQHGTGPVVPASGVDTRLGETGQGGAEQTNRGRGKGFSENARTSEIPVHPGSIPRVGPLREAMRETVNETRHLQSDATLNGITVSTLRSEIAKAFGPRAERMVGDILIPLQTQSDIADHAELSDVLPLMREGDRVSGFYHPGTGKTYAIMENISPEQVRGLVLHEIGIHAGFEGMLSPERYAQVVRQMDVMRKAGNKAVAEAHEQAVKQAARESQVPEETIAYLVTNRPELPFVKRLIAEIKAFLFRKFGILGDRLTVDDIAALARASVLHASEGVRNGEPMFMATAYHGTPHIWPPEPGFPHGRPRLDKIGTGEGAAVYGWGWYSAETEGVGGSYQKLDDFLALNSIGKDWYVVRAHDANQRLAGPFGTEGQARTTLDSMSRGSLYRLDIPNDVLPKLLDWDRPIAEQSPEVLSALDRVIANTPRERKSASDPPRQAWFGAVKFRDKELTGAYVYQSIAGHFGEMAKELGGGGYDFGSKRASEYLASIGIPGNKYLDQGSRAGMQVQQTGQTWAVSSKDSGGIVAGGFATKAAAEASDAYRGTYNFVLWDQKVLDRVAMLERNGEKLDAMREAQFSRSQDQTQTPEFKPGQRVSIDVRGTPFAETTWVPLDSTGTIQKVFGNGSITVAVDQIKNDSADGKRTIRVRKEQLTPLDPTNPDIRFSLSPWISQQPADTQEALRKAGVWHVPPTLKDRIKVWSTDWQKRLKQGVVDQFDPIKEYDYHAYMLARMTRGADAALDGLLHYGTVFLDQDGAVDVNFERGGFLGIMSKLAGEHDRFLAWVIGNRAERLLSEGREHNFTAQDIQRLKALNQGAMKDGTPRAQEYARVRAELDRYNKSVLDIAEKAGLIDGAGRSAWEKDFYVPFYRLMQDESGKQTGPMPSKGLVNQYAFKVLKGGEQALGDPMENLLKNWSHLLDASLKNQAAKESLLAAQRVGVVVEGDEATVRQMAKAAGLKDAVVSFTDQGAQRWFMVEDPFLLDAIKAVGFTGFQGVGMRIMGKFKKWLTLGVTISPTFRIRNVIRDSLQMIGANPASYNVLGNVLTGWKATQEGSPEFASILAGGGVMRFGTLLEGDRAEHVKRLIEAGVDDRTILTTPQKVKDAMQQGWDWWQHVGDRAENVNRAALYKKLRADGKTHLEASFGARDTMDFSMQGTWAAIRFLSQTVPFWNARLQGLYKLGRGAAEDPRRFGIVVGGAAMASIALMLAYQDDDDWKARENWDRETYWAFRIGDTMFRIPKPFEIGAIATIAERGLEAMISDELTGKQFAQRVFSIVSQQLSMNPVPQLAMPLIELYANRDSFTDRPIEGIGLERLSKPMRAGPHTSATAQLLGKNGIVSPVQIDHLVSGYFGWLGAHVVVTADLALRPAMDLPGKPAWRVDDVLVVGDFAKGLPAYQSKYVTRVYDQMKEVQQAMADLKELQKVGATEEARKLLEDKGDKIKLYRLYTHAQQQLTKVNQQIKMAQHRAGTAAEKRDRLNALYERRNKIAEITELRARQTQQ